MLRLAYMRFHITDIRDQQIDTVLKLQAASTHNAYTHDTEILMKRKEIISKYSSTAKSLLSSLENSGTVGNFANRKSSVEQQRRDFPEDCRPANRRPVSIKLVALICVNEFRSFAPVT